MRMAIMSLLLALAAVALLAAQAPNSSSEEQAKAGKASAADDAKGTDTKSDKAEPARGFPRSGEAPLGARGREVPSGARGGFRGSPPGFQPGSRGGFIPPPPTTTRNTEPAERPGLRLPQAMTPLPEGAASAKLLLVDVCFAQTTDVLTQPAAAELLAMERDGKLKSNSRVRLLLLENLTAFAQFGELANRVVGHTTTPVRVMPIYNSVNVGLIVQCTGKVADDGTILLQVYVEKSELEASDAPAETRQPEDIARLLVQSTVRLKPGEPVVVSSGPGSNSDAPSQNWIVLSCQAL
jgi:hypothetical protein